ncbi:MAG: hypothetical protein LRY27_00350 [Chitinophagales bacterium]|nr:hypothetical protein [Chitinophagales bacterium]
MQIDVKRIQFYNSENIILHRQLNSNETGIVAGKIKVIDGKEVEEIIIKKGTPGIVVATPNNEILAVSFELGDNYYLTFGIDPKRGNRYYLRLKDYKKNEYALVSYSDKTYNISPQSLNSFLQVNVKRILKQQNKLRVAKGRKL